MTNEAFSSVKIHALLAAQGWDTIDTIAVRVEVMLPDGISECMCRLHIAGPLAAKQNFRKI